MWPCDKPFQQDELARWEKADWDTKFECEYDGDDVFDNLKGVARLDKEIEEREADREAEFEYEYDGDDICDDLVEVERLDRESQLKENAEDYSGDMLRDPISDGDGDSDADWQHGLEFEDGLDRPKRLWGFTTECPIPALLLTCRESREVALKCYKLAFSSVGGMAQIYFDTFQDTLFIDHETFSGEYEDLPSLIAKYLLPSDLAEVRELAVEGLGPYENTQWDDIPFPYEEWLLETSILFPNVRKVIDVCEHLVYGPQTQIGQKYVDLKRMHKGQDGKDLDGRPDTPENHPAHGTFYVNGLRVDRLFIDWDKLLDRHMACWSGEEQLADLWEEWQEKNLDSKRPDIDFDWADLIPAADERLLLHDAALFEKEHNKGQWFSYCDNFWGVEAKIYSNNIPAHFFT